MPPCHRRVAFSMPVRNINDPPTRARETATVSTDATVMEMFRPRFEVVSRTT
jgi:hypothetical protein